MLKICTLSLFALTTLSTYAEANGLPKPVKGLIQSELKSVTTATPQRRLETAAAGTCADFSGHWAGTCHIKDQDQKISFNLTQRGCDSISFDGDQLDMGHNSVEADSSLFAAANVQTSTRFSQDGQTAKALGTLFVDSPFLADSVSGRLGGEMKLAGEGLQLNGQIDLWIGMKDLASVPVSCELTKAN